MEHVFTTSACPLNRQGTQLEVYSAVKDHFDSNTSTPLQMTISGKASKVLVPLHYSDVLKTLTQKINELKYHLFVRGTGGSI